MKPLVVRRGTVFGKYRVLRYIGAGMEGEVYLVEEFPTGRARTLKVFRSDVVASDLVHIESYYLRFRGIPTVKAFHERGPFRDPGGVGFRWWMAFEYVNGRTLADLIDAGRVLDPLDMAAKLCAALLPIHHRRLVIGDFDHGRNVVVERGTGRFVFCDLDAGEVRGERPTRDDDLDEVVRAIRRCYQAMGARPSRRVVSAVDEASSVEDALTRLSEIGGAPATRKSAR